jgi:hypothetical protein
MEQAQGTRSYARGVLILEVPIFQGGHFFFFLKKSSLVPGTVQYTAWITT